MVFDTEGSFKNIHTDQAKSIVKALDEKETAKQHITNEQLNDILKSPVKILGMIV